MEQKVITNSRIMQAKQDILDLVNAELNQGVPISALILTIEAVLPELHVLLNQTIQKENELMQQQLSEEMANDHEKEVIEDD